MKKLLVLLAVLIICLMPFSGCELFGDNVKFTLEYKDESTEGVFTMHNDLTFNFSVKNYVQSYYYGSIEYSGVCIEKDGNYYISEFDSALMKSYAFGYTLCDIDYGNRLKAGNYSGLGYILGNINEDSFVTYLGTKVLLLKNPKKKYAIGEAAAVVTNNFDSDTQSIKILKNTANTNLKEAMGLYVVYGSGNYDADGIGKIEGIDTSKTGSYTATVTYGDNKTITLPVNVVEDYVKNWPYIRYNWLVDTELSDVINNLRFSTGTKSQIAVTEDMIKGWDSQTEGEKTIE